MSGAAVRRAAARLAREATPRLIPFACLYVIFGNASENSPFFNADSLYLYDLYLDLFVDGHSLKAWFLTPAVFIFPDWPMAFLSRLLAGETHAAVVLHAVFFAVLFVFAHEILFREIFAREPARAARGGAWTAALPYVLYALFPTRARVLEPLLMPVHHGGAYLTSLFALWLVLRVLRAHLARIDTHNVRDSWPSRSALCATGVLIALAQSSDPVFAMMFSAPLIAAAGASLWLERPSGKARVFAAIVGTVCLGSLGGVVILNALGKYAGLLIPAPGGASSAAPGDALANILHARARELLERLNTEPGFITRTGTDLSPLLFWLVLVTACVFVAARYLRGENRPPSNPRLVLLFLAAQIGVGAATAFGAYLWPGMYAARYYIAVFVAPLFAAGLLVQHGLRRNSENGKLRRIVSVAATMLALGIGFLLVTANTPVLARIYPDADCLTRARERFQLRRGLGTYWSARPAMLALGSDVRVAQVDAKLNVHYWMTTYTRYDDPDYDFILLSGLDENMVRAKLGTPSETILCPRERIFIYQGESGRQLRELGARLAAQVRVWRGITKR